jgi:hypothetical protein
MVDGMRKGLGNEGVYILRTRLGVVGDRQLLNSDENILQKRQFLSFVSQIIRTMSHFSQKYLL